jgi:uncharacterized protein (UPF0332 family)
MDPRDFNQVAIDIVVKRPPTGPAANRSAISRAYFAAMNVAADVLISIGHSPGKGDSKHKKLAIYLQHSGEAELNDVGRSIDDLRTIRNTADYDMSDATVEKLSNARFAAESARQIIQDLDDFAADAARKKTAAEAISKYRAATRT